VSHIRRVPISLTPLKSTVSAAAVIGVFSWPGIEDGYWLATSLWYCCLLLSICAGISSAHQSWLLLAMPSLSAELASHSDLAHVLRAVLKQSVHVSLPVRESSDGADGKEHIDWNMVYIWQVPIMFMTYAWGTFVAALSLHVCRPLSHGRVWSRDHKVRRILL
jgi:hypothetical protein